MKKINNNKFHFLFNNNNIIKFIILTHVFPSGITISCDYVTLGHG